jgi:hypothetical protein
MSRMEDVKCTGFLVHSCHFVRRGGCCSLVCARVFACGYVQVGIGFLSLNSALSASICSIVRGFGSDLALLFLVYLEAT